MSVLLSTLKVKYIYYLPLNICNEIKNVWLTKLVNYETISPAKIYANTANFSDIFIYNTAATQEMIFYINMVIIQSVTI